MIDRLFTATLAFAVLAGGSLAIGSELWSAQAPAPQIVQLERVVIVGKRVPASAPLASAEPVSPLVQRLQ